MRETKLLVSPLRYPGGKTRARGVLSGLMLPGVNHVLSPFFGGGSFEVLLAQTGFRVTGFDGFPLLAAFWESVMDDPDRLAGQVGSYVGDVDATRFKGLQKRLERFQGKQVPKSERDRVAEWFYVVNRCSFSGVTMAGGFSKASADTRFTRSAVDRLRLFRVDGLDVRYGLFQETLVSEAVAGMGADFLFLDPPYMLAAGKNKLYGVGGDLHESFDHVQLRRMVESTGLPFMLTYNDCKDVRELWSGYRVVPAGWAYGMNTSKLSSEIVIMNY